MADNKIGELSINEIDKTLFVIPFYQRGYRWTKNNLNQLLKDLVEFQNSSESEYCLQPIVLQELDKELYNKEGEKFNKVYRVVDGQQRLTTIAIVLSVIKKKIEWDIYYVSEEKYLSELLNKDTSTSTSINDYFRKEVFEASKELICDDRKKQLNLLFDLKRIFFLRYDIAIEGKEDPEGHEAFRRLNDGKTPLTSSELIRAFYMVNSNGLTPQERMEISKEWEIIENTLHNKQFWLMFNAKGLDKTPTRMDLLFALILNRNLEHTKSNPRIIFEDLDDGNYDLSKVWKEILKCYWWMQSCFSDVELYNYLCWINEFTEISAATIYKNWKSNPKPCDFKNSIIAIIKKIYEETQFDTVDYSWDKSDLRKLFVLLNVFDCNHTKERFRFDLYKEGLWDIEHIDSQTPNDFKENKDKEEWLKSAWGELSDEIRKKLKAEYNEYFEEPLTINNFESKFELIRKAAGFSDDEKIKNGNLLGNLCLLNTTINRSYKNAIFSGKRKVIKDFLKKGSCFIPPCTAKAFMKFYTQSPSKITYWLNSDFDGYYSTLKKWFDDFMEKNTDVEESVSPEEPDLVKELPKDDLCNTNQDLSTSQSIEEKCDISTEESNKAISFIDFMNQYHIVIPKIQRQYVQGRQNKQGLKCLSDFANSLVESVTDKKPLLLDFIYGIKTNDKKFYPLDGQQRLTTLLLLAWLCGVPNEKWSFKYESRRAVEIFIDGLLKSSPNEVKIPADYAERKKDAKEKLNKDYLPLCSEYIEKSEWFFNAWKDDAGIIGMLEMLDSLYDKLQNKGTKDYSFENISFYVNYLNSSVKSYDQIFLKMNSRGRELTEWDNVKAILDKNIPTEFKDKWQINIQKWYELMWEKFYNNAKEVEKKKEVDNIIIEVDKKMIDFVELALSCCGYNKEAQNTFMLSKWIENTNNKIEVEKFYRICSELFSSLEEDNRIQNALVPNWRDVVYTINFVKTTYEDFYRPLLVYYAAIKSTDNDWMRVVWNLVKNIYFVKEQFPSILKLIDELSQHAQNIYEFLATEDNQIRCSFNDANPQLEEEREKARQILNDERTELRVYNGSSLPFNDKVESTWKEMIITAERYAFFHGAVRFLFRDENGNWSWNDFDIKWNNSKKYFDENGVIKDYQVDITKALVIQCNKWSEQLEEKQIFNPNAKTWKSILTSNNWTSPIKNILCCDNLSNIKPCIIKDDSNVDIYISPIIDKIPYGEIIHTSPESRFKWVGLLALYKPYEKNNDNVITFDWDNFKRNEILSSCYGGKLDSQSKELNEIYTNQKIEDCNFFWGWNIEFEYAEHTFRWQKWNWIDMYDNEKRLIDNEKYKILTINGKEIKSTENLLTRMDECIEDYQKLQGELTLEI